MYTEKTVFSQVMDYVPMYEFRKCIDRYVITGQELGQIHRIK